MCPIRLQNSQTLEASKNPEDWGHCSKECDLQVYGSNQDIYDEIDTLEKTKIEEFKYYNYQEKYRFLIFLAGGLLLLEYLLKNTLFRSFI